MLNASQSVTKIEKSPTQRAEDARKSRVLLLVGAPVLVAVIIGAVVQFSASSPDRGSKMPPVQSTPVILIDGQTTYAEALGQLGKPEHESTRQELSPFADVRLGIKSTIKTVIWKHDGRIITAEFTNDILTNHK